MLVKHFLENDTFIETKLLRHFYFRNSFDEVTTPVHKNGNRVDTDCVCNSLLTKWLKLDC